MQLSHETKRAKRIVVELVRLLGDVGDKTLLDRAFWQAHMAYADTQPGYLSNWPVVCASSGPAIGDFDTLVAEMLADDWLTLSGSRTGAADMTLSLGVACPPSTLPDAALESLRTGIRTAQSTPDAHLRSRVWREGTNGEELPIYLDLDTDEVRDQREANFAALAEAMETVYESCGK